MGNQFFCWLPVFFVNLSCFIDTKGREQQNLDQ